MIKKVFLFAAVTTLAGAAIPAIVSGCSSSTNDAPPPSNSVDASEAAAPRPDSGWDDEEDEEKDAGPSTCPSTHPITTGELAQTYPTWVPPAPPSDACTDEMAKITAFLEANEHSFSLKELKDLVSEKCGNCIFSAPDAETGQLFMRTQEVDAGVLDVVGNVASSCMAQQDGAECGKAQYDLHNCQLVACPFETCNEQPDKFANCFENSSNSACKDLNQTYRQACTKAGVEGYCFSTRNSILASYGAGAVK